MDKERFNKAKEILQQIEHIEGLIKKVDETDSIYYKTPDMDGGYTPGRYCEFYDSEMEDVKEVLKSYFQCKIDELNKDFEAL